MSKRVKMTIELDDDGVKLEHVQVCQVPVEDLKPAPENELVYRPVLPDDPGIEALAESIKEYGIREPLVITEDNFILSGHRRLAAAKLAGLSYVPCRVEKINREEEHRRFIVLLREHNRQRRKGLDEILRETVIDSNKEKAHAELVEYRRNRARVKAKGMAIDGGTRRCAISEAKRPFLDAVLSVINTLEDYWPLSDRQIHYQLLNNPPLIHASKPGSVYRNDLASYRALTDLLTRARLEGAIPWEVIEDPTRPVETWNLNDDCDVYLNRETDGFLKNYFRNLMQSQPCHVEILAEKLTVRSIVEQVAMEYCIPVTIGRGYCSLQPRYAMAQRFKKSGKEKMVVLLISDFDPDGEEIAQSFARSLRDDFVISNIKPIKVALTGAQVKKLKLPPMMQAKIKSSKHDKFVSRHGRNVYELEAVPPAKLQKMLREAIESVINHEAFEAERQKEAEDAEFLRNTRRLVLAVLGESRGI
jgi:hypothetical protein